MSERPVQRRKPVGQSPAQAGEGGGVSVKDAGLIVAAQRVEHYEIAAYGTAKAFADTLGHSEHVSLLEETLEEEKQTDKKLTDLARQINAQAERQRTRRQPEWRKKASELPGCCRNGA